MATITQFRREMQPARPYPEGALPSEPPTFELPTEDQFRRLEGVETLTLLVELHGLATVERWLRHVKLVVEGSQR